MHNKTTAGSLLVEAYRAVTGPRDRTHGAKLPNHENIARLWRAYLWNKGRGNGLRTTNPAWDLGPEDVAIMMVLLKVARTQMGGYNPDDYLDMAGYAACAGEIVDSQTIEPEVLDDEDENSVGPGAVSYGGELAPDKVNHAVGADYHDEQELSAELRGEDPV